MNGHALVRPAARKEMGVRLKRMIAVWALLLLLVPAWAGRAENAPDGYQMKSRITTVLLLGIDKTSASASSGLRNGGQADYQIVAVIDDREKAVYSLQIKNKR